MRQVSVGICDKRAWVNCDICILQMSQNEIY